MSFTLTKNNNVTFMRVAGQFDVQGYVITLDPQYFPPDEISFQFSTVGEGGYIYDWILTISQIGEVSVNPFGYIAGNIYPNLTPVNLLFSWNNV